MKILKYTSLLLLIILAYACKERFSPPATEANNNFLVVEGLIESNGTDSTIIQLSRTVKLTDVVTTKPETGATLTLEGTNGSVTTFTLTLREVRAGIYYATALPTTSARPGLKCRLKIRTRTGQEYLSDYVDIKSSPVIEKLTWTAKTTGIQGVQINISTRDDTKSSVYYKWDFKETYMFRSAFRSTFEIRNTTIAERDMFNNDIWTCWRTTPSTAIILGSTARLAQDVIADAPVTLIPAGSEKTGIRYSTLVRQVVLTEDAYNFWENLRKNTEQVGSIFDAQPSQLQGNIRNTSNSQEIVIGYISACATQSKRIFIDNTELPLTFRYNANSRCAVDSVRLNQVPNFFFRNPPSGIPVSAFYDGDTLLGYTASSRECVDCTLKGTNKKPAFWQ